MDKKTILVTGSGKGIGFEIVRQLASAGHTVIGSTRDEEQSLKASEQLKALGLEVPFISMDITIEDDIRAAALIFNQRFGKLHVLINNAGILLKEDISLLINDPRITEMTFKTNAFAALNVTRHFISHIPKGGQIIMTSSGGGSMSDSVGGWAPAYCASKTLLNGITRQLAWELRSRQILVNAFCPGWVKTDMGGKSAPRSVSLGAETATWLATSHHEFTGQFFRDRKVIPW